jgi:hypothetical protein
MVKYKREGNMKPNNFSENNSGRPLKKPVRQCSAMRNRDLAVQVNLIKDGLIREFGMALGGHGDVLRSALNEAEALAWQTPYPHLLFPVLAQEKASAVNLWAARQRNVARASREISLVE